MDLIYPIEDSVIKGKFVADKASPKDFDGHLEVEVSGETLGVADVYNVMKDLDNDCVIKVVSPKTFQVQFVKKESIETLFNGVVCIFENNYALSEQYL